MGRCNGRRTAGSYRKSPSSSGTGTGSRWGRLFRRLIEDLGSTRPAWRASSPFRAHAVPADERPARQDRQPGVVQRVQLLQTWQVRWPTAVSARPRPPSAWTRSEKSQGGSMLTNTGQTSTSSGAPTVKRVVREIQSLLRSVSAAGDIIDAADSLATHPELAEFLRCTAPGARPTRRPLPGTPEADPEGTRHRVPLRGRLAGGRGVTDPARRPRGPSASRAWEGQRRTTMVRSSPARYELADPDRPCERRGLRAWITGATAMWRPRSSSAETPTRCCASCASRHCASIIRTCWPRPAGPRTTTRSCSPWSWSRAARGPSHRRLRPAAAAVRLRPARPAPVGASPRCTPRASCTATSSPPTSCSRPPAPARRTLPLGLRHRIAGRAASHGDQLRRGDARLLRARAGAGRGARLPRRPSSPRDLVALYLLEGAKPDSKALIEHFADHGTPGAPQGVPGPLWCPRRAAAARSGCPLPAPPPARARPSSRPRSCCEPGPDDELVEGLRPTSACPLGSANGPATCGRRARPVHTTATRLTPRASTPRPMPRLPRPRAWSPPHRPSPSLPHPEPTPQPESTPLPPREPLRTRFREQLPNPAREPAPRTGPGAGPGSRWRNRSENRLRNRARQEPVQGVDPESGPARSRSPCRRREASTSPAADARRPAPATATTGTPLCRRSFPRPDA